PFIVRDIPLEGCRKAEVAEDPDQAYYAQGEIEYPDIVGRCDPRNQYDVEERDELEDYAPGQAPYAPFRHLFVVFGGHAYACFISRSRPSSRPILALKPRTDAAFEGSALVCCT